jgi:hypothetical protein
MHLVCEEMYVVLSGYGAVELVTCDGFQRVDLYPGAVVGFTPGTLHRLITASPATAPRADGTAEDDLEPDPDPLNGPGSTDGLEVLVVMENGHLNESGDAVLTFPATDLADPDRYARLASAATPAQLRARRDLAVRGFTELARSWQADPAAGVTALRAFHRQATAIVQDRALAWPAIAAEGPLAAAERLAARASAIAAADPAHLSNAAISIPPDARRPAAGPLLTREGAMCGWRHSYRPNPAI